MKTTVKTKNDLQTLASPPKTGETVEGRIIGTSRFAVYVDLGAIGVGIIYGKEYYSAKDALKHIGPGEKIKAKIVTVDNEDGYLELSLREAQREMGWENLQEIEKNSESVIVNVAGANKGGLLAELEGIRGFLPLSQLSIKHYPRVQNGDTAEILKNLQQLVGQELKVKIIDASPQENKLIFSEKAVTSKAITQLLEQFKPGDTVKGRITGLADFGAFIKFPVQQTQGKTLPKAAAPDKESLQAEGLIHISELDWQLIDNVSEIVKVGDIVKAKITDVAKDGKVSLSLKALKPDPWKGIEEKYKKGDVVEGKVVKINQLGAFVEIAPKIRGLVHLSELGFQDKIKDTLAKGKKYKFEIIALDEETHKMGLRPQNT
jgi:small subunit ribosomal protein S1